MTKTTPEVWYQALENIDLYSNHPETIIKYFVTNLNKHEHSIGAGISFIDLASVYIITIKELQ